MDDQEARLNPKSWDEWDDLSLKEKAEAILNRRYESALEAEGYTIDWSIRGHNVYVADWKSHRYATVLEISTVSEFVKDNDYWVTDRLE